MRSLISITICLVGPTLALVQQSDAGDGYSVLHQAICGASSKCDLSKLRFDKLEEHITNLRFDPNCDKCSLHSTGTVNLRPTICKDKEGKGGVLGLKSGFRTLPNVLKGGISVWNADSACLNQMKQATLFFGDEENPCTAKGDTVNTTIIGTKGMQVVDVGTFFGGVSFKLTDVSKCSGLANQTLEASAAALNELDNYPPNIDTNLGWAVWFNTYHPPHVPEGTREVIEPSETRGAVWGPAARCSLGSKVTGIILYYVTNPTDYYTRSIQLICDDDEVLFSAEEKHLWTGAVNYSCPKGTSLSGIETTNDKAGTHAIKDVTVHCAGTGLPMAGGKASEEGKVYTTATFRGDSAGAGFELQKEPAKPKTACDSTEDMVGFSTSMTYNAYSGKVSGIFAQRTYCAQRVPKYCD